MAARRPRARLRLRVAKIRIPARPIYTGLVVAGGGLVVAGVAMVFVPAAFVLAGLLVGSLGLIGLGMRRPS